MEVRPICLFTLILLADTDLDIRANNIVFTANKLSKLDKKGLFEIIGEPSAEKVTAINGAALMTGQPSQLFKAATWERWDDNDEEDIELIDFGQSFPRADPRPDDVYHTPDYRAPETVLNEDFDWRIDLWSVGITVSGMCADRSRRDCSRRDP